MFRVGIGTDRHRLVFGRKLIIGGVQVENAKGGHGHSDRDVLAHSVIDALLGAADWVISATIFRIMIPNGKTPIRWR